MPTKKERLKEIVNEQVAKLMEVSRKEQQAVEQAKTNVKRKYHLRKLKKNNQELANVLIAAEKYTARLENEIDEHNNTQES